MMQQLANQRHRALLLSAYTYLQPRFWMQETCFVVCMLVSASRFQAMCPFPYQQSLHNTLSKPFRQELHQC